MKDKILGKTRKQRHKEFNTLMKKRKLNKYHTKDSLSDCFIGFLNFIRKGKFK